MYTKNKNLGIIIMNTRVMIKAIFTILILIQSMVINTFGCDVCGCKVGGSLAGSDMESDKHYIGVSYNFNQYETKVDWTTENRNSGGNYLANEYSKDKYHQFDYLVNLAINEKFRIAWNQPIKYQTVVSSETEESLYGFGDPLFQIQWFILTSEPGYKKVISNHLSSSLGVQIPLGESNSFDKNGNKHNENFQLGVGAHGYYSSFKHTLRYFKYGLHTEAMYLMNSTNALEYKRGDQKSFQTSLLFYDQWRYYSYNIKLGTSYDHSGRDKSYGFLKANRGGESWSAITSTQWRWDQYTMLLGLSIPLLQSYHIDDNASLSGGSNWTLSVGYYFK
tara:strand:- start:586 stop:1587 length:1002 start_codon:yes stop_codon:yes gene_type:complete